MYEPLICVVYHVVIAGWRDTDSITLLNVVYDLVDIHLPRPFSEVVDLLTIKVDVVVSCLAG